jgi:hypothetical protein
MAHLVFEIEKAIRYAKRDGYVPVFRLNGTSDIRWESIPCKRDIGLVHGANNQPSLVHYPSIMHAFPDIQFYDYTKIANRRNIPANYALTFSLAENNTDKALAAFNSGMNVAVVFRNKATVARYIDQGFLEGPVTCGDDTDLRFLDPAGHIVALYAKGQARKDTSGFVRD